MSCQTPLPSPKQWPSSSTDQIPSLSMKRPAPFEITNRPVKARRPGPYLDSFYNHGNHNETNNECEVARAPSTRMPGLLMPSHSHQCHEIKEVRAPIEVVPNKGTITHRDSISTQSHQGRSLFNENHSSYAASITTDSGVNITSNAPQSHAITAETNMQNTNEVTGIEQFKTLSSTAKLLQPYQFRRIKHESLESRHQSQLFPLHKGNSSVHPAIGSQECPIVIDDSNNSFNHRKARPCKRHIAENLDPLFQDRNAFMPPYQDNSHSILTEKRMESAPSSTVCLDGISLPVAKPSAVPLPFSNAASSTPQFRMFQGVLARQRARYLPKAVNYIGSDISQEGSPLSKPRDQMPNSHQQPHVATSLNGRKLPSKSVQPTVRHEVNKDNNATLAPQQPTKLASSPGFASRLCSQSTIHSTKTDSASKAPVSTYHTRHQHVLTGTISSSLSEDFALTTVDTLNNISELQGQKVLHSLSIPQPSIAKSPKNLSSGTFPSQLRPVPTMDLLHEFDTGQGGKEIEEVKVRLLKMRQRQKDAKLSAIAEQAEVQRQQRQMHALSRPHQTHIPVMAAPTEGIEQTTANMNAAFESMKPPAAGMGTVCIEQAATLMDRQRATGGLLDRIAEQDRTESARLALRPKYGSAALTTTGSQFFPTKRLWRPDGRKKRHEDSPIAPEKVTDDDWTIFTLHNRGMSFRDVSENWGKYSESRHHYSWFQKRYKRMTLTYPDLVSVDGPIKDEVSDLGQRAREQRARNTDIVERLRKGEDVLDLITNKKDENTTKALHETMNHLPTQQTSRPTTAGKTISKELEAYLFSIASNEVDEEEEENDTTEHFGRQASPHAREEDTIHYAYTVKRRTLRTDQADAEWYICGQETDDLCEANAMAAAELQKPRDRAVWPLTSWTYDTNHNKTGMLSCYGSCSAGSVEVKVDRVCRTVDQGYQPKSKLRWFNREVWDVLMKETTVEQAEEWAEDEVEETELDYSVTEDFQVVESPSEDATGIELNNDAVSNAGTDMDSLFGDNPEHLLPTPASSFNALSDQGTEDVNFPESKALEVQSNEDPTAQPVLNFDDRDCAMVDAELATERKDSQKNVSTPERSRLRDIAAPIKKVRAITRTKHIIRHTTTTIKHVGGVYGSLDRANRQASRVYLDFIRKMDPERKKTSSMAEYERCKAEDADMRLECDELDEEGNTFHRAIALVEDDENEEGEEDGTPTTEFWVESRRLENPRNLC